jgi:pimeloyl-ACP methyl ester carboxylesterase
MRPRLVPRSTGKEHHPRIEKGGHSLFEVKEWAPTTLPVAPGGGQVEDTSVDTPDIHYAWNGPVSLAWESSYLAKFLRGLAAHARVIATDRRGWGLSDRFAPDAVPPLETLTDDVQTVMDAAGSSRAVVFGSWDCGALAMLVAATHPGRAAGIILCDTFPTFAVTEDTPTMPTARDLDEIDVELHEHWGRDFGDEAWGGPPRPRDPRERDWFRRYTRASVAPGGLIAEGRRLVELDARPVLPSIHAPTLVVGFRHGRGVLDPAISRVLAERIPNARLAQIGDVDDPADAGWWHWYGRGDAIVREIGVLLEDVHRRTSCSIAYWRPCCSRTSSTRLSVLRRSVIRPGKTW